MALEDTVVKTLTKEETKNVGPTRSEKEIKIKMESKELVDEKILFIELENEDHTIGEILNYELQNNENLFSAVSKPNHLIKNPGRQRYGLGKMSLNT